MKDKEIKIKSHHNLELFEDVPRTRFTNRGYD